MIAVNFRFFLILALIPLLVAAKKSDVTTNWMAVFADLLLMTGLVGVAVALDRLVLGRGWQSLERLLIQKIHPNQRAWLKFGSGLLRQAGRIILWIALVTTIIRLSVALQPLEQPLGNLVSWAGLEISLLFNRPLLDLGRNKISLGFLVLLIVLSVAVFFTSHWLSEWFKRSVLRGLEVERGAQETITRIISYCLTLIGLMILLQTAGLDLSSLTVVAGVLGIGIGFGLQNLASNFVSGLAILIEQPIKVGDFIEVDGLSGTVEKISIRSTVVRTNDSQFVIVPNNRFIERNVINWSYQSPESRLHIPVGVAYGSNTGQVTEALLNAARKDSRILLYPPPCVWFRGFGDNAYLFELLVWINRPQDAEPIRSALNFLIEQELQRQGIQIPFPQRDIYLHGLEGSSKNLTSAVQKLRNQAPETSPATPTRQHRELRNMLRKVSYFGQCTDQQLDLLIEQGKPRTYRTGTVIFRPGDPSHEIYLIISGSVEIRSERLNQSLATCHGGESFGDVTVLTGMARLSTVIAVESCNVFVINLQSLKNLLQEDPQLAESIANDLSARQQVLQELGFMSEDGNNDRPLPSFAWFRQRLQALFNV
ncbi:mechanosensitive ion channel [Thermosynechococcaceae cyanobacterium BACA0444]|uniref:Mechanosensitive ion channel n=1 Tax=Pseudocalidococcus azoricus BACA0444 TaxID=2918990 RepID=A0AAE4JXT6_9CYAN|nr:mechanosensitive ion channel domain-containing protein [Pseudocalidococcus azoricus]MDS3861358.1 mechanosensitive ion channel [Pseudocalidococcus azoricus BACA0444]